MSTFSDAFRHEETMPEWVVCFLGKTFFEKCQAHNLQRNDINRYCISCDASMCKFCVELDDHKEHELLTIYRHVYHNVVPLNEMEKFMECKNIQPYKCNKKWVVSLTPLPHTGSGMLMEGNGACTTCKRKLTDPDNFRFCSIGCKYEAVIERRVVPHLQGGNSMQVEREEEVEQTHDKEQSLRKRRRKGVPHRGTFSNP